LERELYFYDYVDRSASDVLDALVKPGHGVFQAATTSAVAEAHRFKDRLHVGVAGLDIGRDVVIDVSEPVDKGFATFVGIKWHAVSQAALFPSMDAELEIAPLSLEPPRTQIAIHGRYRPPIGVFGAIGDAMLGHRVAEASVRSFIGEIARRLTNKAS